MTPALFEFCSVIWLQFWHQPTNTLTYNRHQMKSLHTSTIVRFWVSVGCLSQCVNVNCLYHSESKSPSRSNTFCQEWQQ